MLQDANRPCLVSKKNEEDLRKNKIIKLNKS